MLMTTALRASFCISRSTGAFRTGWAEKKLALPPASPFRAPLKTILGTGGGWGNHMACLRRPLTFIAPIAGAHASPALILPWQRGRQESASAAARSEVVCTVFSP